MARLTNLNSITGSGRQVASLLSLIRIQKTPANISNLRLVLAKNEGRVFDLREILRVFCVLVAHEVMVFNLSLQVPSLSDLSVFCRFPETNRPEKQLLVHTVTVLLDAECFPDHKIPKFYVSCFLY